MAIKLTVTQPSPVELEYVEAQIKPETVGHITPTYEAQTVYPASGTVFGSVEVDAIPDPTAVKEIDSNGDFDVRRYGVARVDVQPDLQDKTVTPTESAQTVTADSGYDGLQSVEVGRIPQEYIIPTGTKNISQNGTESVREYDSVDVSVQPNLQTGEATPTEQTQTITPDGQHDGFSSVTVNPIPSQYIVPTGTVPIAVNGLVDVSQYANANVQVPQGVFPQGTKQITENGTGIDVTNFAAVDVNVPSIQPTGTLQITQDGTYNVEQYKFATVNTTPAKGYILSDYDADGYPTTATVKGITTIGDYFFYSPGDRLFSHLENLNLEEGLVSMGGYQFDYTQIRELYLPDSVVSIGTNFAANNNIIELVSFGCYEFSFFGNSAFSGSVLKTIIFRNNTKAFPTQQNGYAGYPSVTLIDFSHNTEVAILSTATNFRRANGCVIKVPTSLLTEWQNATNWNALTNVVWEGV